MSSRKNVSVSVSSSVTRLSNSSAVSVFTSSGAGCAAAAGRRGGALLGGRGRVGLGVGGLRLGTAHPVVEPMLLPPPAEHRVEGR